MISATLPRHRGQFLVAWARSSTIAEVVAKTGFTPRTCMTYATRLRRVGHKLKRMSNGGHYKPGHVPTNARCRRGEEA